MNEKPTFAWMNEAAPRMTKEHREAAACQRRLKQMQARREKEAKRKAMKEGQK